MTYATFSDMLKTSQVGKTKKSQEWFNAGINRLSKTMSQKMVAEADPFSKHSRLTPNSIGRMHMFCYEAKGRETLPYWDLFPLVFPVEFYRDGMLSLNLHYLPPVYRAKLMDALMDTETGGSEEKRLKLSYALLKGAAKYRFFSPCVKKHLFSQVTSQFIQVNPAEWKNALFLPTERMTGASLNQVWQDSLAKIRKR